MRGIARGRRRDEGSAALWVLTSALMLSLIAVAVGLCAVAVAARHRAEAVADSAALAAAAMIGVDADPCQMAARAARAGGMKLETCRLDLAADQRSGTVRVTVVTHIRLASFALLPVSASSRAGRLVAPGSGAQRGAL